MKKIGLNNFLIFIFLFSIFGVYGCGDGKVIKKEEVVQEEQSEELDILNDAIELKKNDVYYESDALRVEEGNNYVFRLQSPERNVSTIYLYNARKRMGTKFLDGQIEGREDENTYWTVRVFDKEKNEIKFDNINSLTNQFCFSNDWNDFYEFRGGETYYFWVIMTKNENGTFYLSLY